MIQSSEDGFDQETVDEAATLRGAACSGGRPSPPLADALSDRPTIIIGDSRSAERSGLRLPVGEGGNLSKEANKWVDDLRRRLRVLVQPGCSSPEASALFEFYRVLHFINGWASAGGLRSVSRLCSSLEGLLNDLQTHATPISASQLGTIAKAIDTLPCLFESARKPEGVGQSPPLVFVVDNEILARRYLSFALGKAGLRAISVENSQVALALLEENQVDLIFSDVDMPGMDGIEFCTRLRQLPNHRTTPVVFVTGFTDFDHRTRTTLAGGTDYIAKPFLPSELGVKALTYVLRGTGGDVVKQS